MKNKMYQEKSYIDSLPAEPRIVSIHRSENVGRRDHDLPSRIELLAIVVIITAG